VSKDVFAAIKLYAQAYAALEVFQGDQSPLPRGDQKTGVIGEYYARLFARHYFEGATLIFGKPSQREWDIRVHRPGSVDYHIQVKAVSAHSTTSRISPIHRGWDELYLFRLDKVFAPEHFWTLCKSDCNWSSSTLKASTMPRGTLAAGPFVNATDRMPELIEILKVASVFG
jgi:hypothetical protein